MAEKPAEKPTTEQPKRRKIFRDADLPGPPRLCPICFQQAFEFDGPPFWDSPKYHDVDTTCTHELCDFCWDDIYKVGDRRCPICRVDLHEWLASRASDDESSDESSSSVSASVE